MELRFHVEEANWLPPVLRDRLALLHRNRLNRRGELVLTSSRHRTQESNLRDALDKLQTMLEQCNEREEERIATEVPEWSKKQRLKDKKVRGERKALRRRDAWD